MHVTTRLAVASTAFAVFAASSSGALAQKKYDTGATDTEIKIGNIKPYSGPASAYGMIGKTEAAYFKKINAEGGINGRKINFITYDDGYSPPKTVEQARKLVESDEVLFVFNPLGTPPNSAIQKYMNSKKVPQLFVATGATKWDDPKDFPWTMGWQPNYQSEAQHLRQVHPEEPSERQDRRALSERRLRQGLPEGPEGRPRRQGSLDDRARGDLRDHRADRRHPDRQAEGHRRRRVLQHHHAEVRRAGDQEGAEIGWKPVHFLNNVSASVGSVIKPAGFENAQDIISAAYLKDPTDPQWDNDAGMKEWLAFMDKYYPGRRQASTPHGRTATPWRRRLVQVLKQCGDDLTRENVMKQAASLKNLQLPSAAARHQDQHQRRPTSLRSSSCS